MPIFVRWSIKEKQYKNIQIQVKCLNLTYRASQD